MIRITMARSNGRSVGFDCTGHAGFAEEGKDIVCSAVSAVTQTAVIGITEIAKIPAGVSVGDDGIRCILGADATETQCGQADLLLSSMEAGLVAIGKAYPHTLKITDREV